MVEILVILALTLTGGVLAGAEIAVIAVRTTRLDELARRGRSGAALTRLRGEPDRFLATVQIGITVVGATAAAFGGATIAERVSPSLEALGLSRSTAETAGVAAVVLLVSYLSLVLGELVPKSLALKWSERYATLVARPLLALSRLSAPLVWLLTSSSNLVLRLFGDRTWFGETGVTRDELLTVLARAAKSGELSPRAREIAARAVELDELHAGAVMVPRAAVVAVDAEATPEELTAFLETTDEERFPVRRGNAIVGFVATRDIARLCAGRASDLAAIVRPVLFVPEVARALDLLERLQAERVPIAVVVDESGAFEGIVDIDDLAEEVVGSLLVGEPMDDPRVVHEPSGAFVVAAATRVHVVNRALDVDLPTSPRWSTVGGLVLSELGALPEPGATVTLEDGTELEVVEASARRVHRVRIRKHGGPASEER